MTDYSDIIDLPKPKSLRHAQMPRANRAAQFSPFAALTGLDKAMDETARLTDEKPELDEMEKEKLNERLIVLKDSVECQPEISISYFVPDEQKSGGAIVSVSGRVRKIDPMTATVMLTNGSEIKINDIIDLESPLFDELDGRMC